MVLNSNSISLTTQEPTVATLDATWSEGSKSSDKEGTRAGEEERRPQQEEDVNEDQRKKLQEQLTLEKERELQEQQDQEEREQKQRQAEAVEQKRRAEEQMRQAERERETSVKIYQYRRSVPMAKGHGRFFNWLGLAVAVAHFKGTYVVFLLPNHPFSHTSQHKQPE